MASGGVGLISPIAGMTSPPRRCQHFIERQQRHCTSIVQQSDQIYCSLHLPEALQVARERSVHAAAAHGNGAASSSTGARGRYRRLESQHLATRADGTAVIEPLQWADPDLPLHLDIGCARGRWLLELGGGGRRWSGLANHVGVEIRSALVDAANEAADERGVGGCVQYVAADMARANGTRDQLLALVAPRLAAVSILFPDPYKPGGAPKGSRGRTLSADLASALADAMLCGGVVFLASDVSDVFEDMVSVLRAAVDRTTGALAFEAVGGGDGAADAALARALWLRGGQKAPTPSTDPTSASAAADDAYACSAFTDDDGLGRNLWRVPTEREMVCETADGAGEYRRVHRALFVRRRAMRRVDEGRARLAVAAAMNGKPGATAGFFNLQMRTNRELCVHEMSAALAAGPWRAGGTHSDGGEDGSDEGDDGGEGLGAEGHPVRALDAFAATGALAIRLALEASDAAARTLGVSGGGLRPLSVTAVDVDERCIHLARTSAWLSGVPASSVHAAVLSSDDGRGTDVNGPRDAAPTPPHDASAAPRAPLHAMATLLAADDDCGRLLDSAAGSTVTRSQAATSSSDATSTRVAVRLSVAMVASGARVAAAISLFSSPLAPPPAAARVTHEPTAPLLTPAATALRLAHADARALLFLEPLAFDYAHLDPFGSCAPYLDPFLARCPHGGLISLTATDTSTLYAHYPTVGRRLYAADLSRADGCWREVAVRALCAAAATAAARQTRGIWVLHATSAAHFVHVLVRVKRGAAAADASVALVRTLTTPDGATLGPLWAGALNAPRFLRRCVAAAAAAASQPGASAGDVSAAASARTLFQRSLEDPGLPPFSVPTGHTKPALLVDALRARGFRACASAFDGDAAKPHGSKRVRTDAPLEVLSDLGVRLRT